MSDENESKEADPNETVEIQEVDGLPLVKTTAENLVADDTDSPIADNKLPPPESASAPAPTPAEVFGDSPKRRGRPPWTEEERALRKKRKAERDAGINPPDFTDLGGRPAGATPQSPLVQPTAPRNFYFEAMTVFVPASTFASGMLGAHWGVEIDQEKKEVKLTPEQQAFVTQMASWMEYEKFGPMNPRYMFIAACLAYSIPKLKTDPTPERLKIIWVRTAGFFSRAWSFVRKIFGNKK